MEDLPPRVVTEINRIRRANPALQQTSNIRFLGVEHQDVIAYVKHSPDETNAVVVAIGLTRDFKEFWLPLADVQVRTADGALRPIAALENLKSGPTSRLSHGGVKLWIDPMHDPFLIFRCLGE